MKRALPLILISSLIFPIQSPANAAIKAGSKCSILGSSTVELGKKFTCTKSGSKLLWSKGVSTFKTGGTSKNKAIIDTVDNYRFNSICGKDPFVPSEWKEYEAFGLRWDIFGCAHPLRFKMTTLPNSTPSSAITAKNDLNAIGECKLSHGRRPGGQIAFSTTNSPEIVLNKRANIQVIPIEFTDFPSSKSVEADHEKYFRFIKDGYFNLSDGQVNMNFRVPSSYYKINKRIDSYVLPGRYSHGGEPWNWPNMNMDQMFRDISEVIGSTLNFSDNDMAFIVVPPNTNNEYIGNGSGISSSSSTNESRRNELSFTPWCNRSWGW